MNIRMQAMSQQSSMAPTPSSVGGSKEEMSPSSMSPHHGNSMGGMGSPHHVAGVKPGAQQSTQKPPPAVLQVVKQVSFQPTEKFLKNFELLDIITVNL